MSRSTAMTVVLMAATALPAMAQVTAQATAQTRPSDGLSPTQSLTPNPIYEVAPARAAAAGADVHLQNTKDNLEDFIRTQRFVFESSAAYSGALAEQEAAYQKYASEKKRVIDGLMVSPDYEATVKLRDETGRQVEIEQAREHPSKAQIDALAAYRMSLGRKVSEMENAAMSQDSGLGDARAALVASSAKVNAMKREFDLRLRTSQQFADAKQTVKDAREQFAYANVYADQTARSADILLNYAYYTTYRATRKPAVVSPLIPYAYGGYGYGGLTSTGVGLTPGVTPVLGTVGGAGYGYVPYQ